MQIILHYYPQQQIICRRRHSFSQKMLGKLGSRSIRKRLVICMNLKEHPQIKIDEEELEVVTDFTYLGSNISVENSVQKDISVRINKARNSYCSLRNIYKSYVSSLKTKVRICNSKVISVLLYGCQSWGVSKNDMHKLDVFQTKCLRRICNIFWPMKICT